LDIWGLPGYSGIRAKNRSIDLIASDFGKVLPLFPSVQSTVQAIEISVSHLPAIIDQQSRKSNGCI
jgi:hypothetical protein